MVIKYWNFIQNIIFALFILIINFNGAQALLCSNYTNVDGDITFIDGSAEHQLRVIYPDR